MYRCYASGVVVPAKRPAHKVIIQVRRKEYPFRRKAVPVRIPGKKNKVLRDDPGGVGFEPVREVLMCETAALAFNEAITSHPSGVEALTDPATVQQFLKAAKDAVNAY
ncbi:MAG: hypothetical protein H6739_20350 [Alphaproteobacteria bacterium]|nr:hypothetical protein [Alphaproteobacteria bacterium]